MASGHVNRIKRPNTWLYRPACGVKKVLANSEPSTHGTCVALNDGGRFWPKAAGRPSPREGMEAMKREQGNWVDYRKRFGLSADDEVDLHFGPRDPHVRYEQVMVDVQRHVEESLRKAQENGRPYLMFVHGWSTSRPGQTPIHAVKRGYAIYSESRQHPASHGVHCKD